MVTVDEAKKNLDTRVSGLNPELIRQDNIKLLLGRPSSATLCRLNLDMMVVEALLDSGQELGIFLPASRRFAVAVREMSPGLDGKGIAIAADVLAASSRPNPIVLPGTPGPVEHQPGLIERLGGFFMGSGSKGDGRRG